MNETKQNYLGLILLALALAVLPYLSPNNYFLDLAIRMILNAGIVIGLNLLIGFAGQISLGHAGFLGVGAYASAVLTTHYNWPAPLAMLAGAIAAGVLAALVARPIFKLKGHYLAMATLGLGIILSIVAKNEAAWTGGPDGMPVPAFVLFGWEISGERQWYWVVSAVLLVSVLGAINLIDSPFGRALRALHGSEVAAQTVGIDLARYKSGIFVLSAIYASFMGSLMAHYIGFVTPNVAEFFHSIELVTMVVIGGMASVYGSVLGAVLLTALPQALAAFEGWETVVFGSILISCMIFMPRGLVPTLAARFRRHS